MVVLCTLTIPFTLGLRNFDIWSHIFFLITEKIGPLRYFKWSSEGKSWDVGSELQIQWIAMFYLSLYLHKYLKPQWSPVRNSLQGGSQKWQEISIVAGHFLLICKCNGKSRLTSTCNYCLYYLVITPIYIFRVDL